MSRIKVAVTAREVSSPEAERFVTVRATLGKHEAGPAVVRSISHNAAVLEISRGMAAGSEISLELPNGSVVRGDIIRKSRRLYDVTFRSPLAVADVMEIRAMLGSSCAAFGGLGSSDGQQRREHGAQSTAASPGNATGERLTLAQRLRIIFGLALAAWLLMALLGWGVIEAAQLYSISR